MKSNKRDAEKRNYKDYFILSYIILVSLVSIVLFLYGFFPANYSKNVIATRKDIPKFIERTRIKVDEVYKPVVRKLIIMVIDALRWDFVTGSSSNNVMPITSGLLESKSGCIYKTKVNPPTVTMPRIKAMTTGSVPNFIDVILNLGAHEIMGDSILKQAKSHDHKIIFYGDDTWLKLFPSQFYRHEGTTSFYVNDFIEVDNNVTRNVANELLKDDWTIMILHYLGLDHIGHVAGPFSPLIKPKLIEMDQIIGGIASYVSESNKIDTPTLFLVCGDHGMKDSGGHGGSSIEETLVPLIVFGTSCSNKKNPDEEISQIDIAPTLSAILGIPIPSSNLGSVVLDLMVDQSLSQKLFILYYNSEQLFLKFQKLDGYQSTEAYKNYKNAMKLHVAWLHTNSHPNEMVHDIILMYESSILEMKNTLTGNLLKYDVYTMTLATIFLGQLLYISISTQRPIETTHRHFLIVFVVCYVSWMFLTQFFDKEVKPTLVTYLKNNSSSWIAILLLVKILFINCYLCATRNVVICELQDFNSMEILLPLGTILHTLSLASSSFVEEEHQTWYFYWITIITFLTYDVLKKYSKQKSKKLPLLLLFLMISHRILRKLNSTGDKYAHLPDISGWLQNSETNYEMTIVLVLALASLIIMDYIYDDSGARKMVLAIDICMAILIYLRHAITKIVFIPNFYFGSHGVMEVSYFWAFVSIFLIHCVYRLKATKRFCKQKVLPVTLFIMVKTWMMICCLLHRPYNVILLPMQVLVGFMIHNLTKIPEYCNIKLHLYLWSSSAFYFYQGNSNSIATVDVAAGYVGLESYQPLVTGVYVCINTYSAQILGFLMYLYDHTLQHPNLVSKDMLLLCKQYAFWRLLPVFFYTIVTSLQRYHLFVWTVFSPKLLYEATHSAILFVVIFFLQLNFFLCDRVIAQKKVL